MFPFDASRQARRLVRRGLDRTARQAARSFEAAAKAATRSAERAMDQAGKSTLRSTESAIREAGKATERTLDRMVRGAGKVTEAFGAPREREVARRPSGRFVTVDGLPVHVIVRGRGRPVVLVHGNGTMAEDFAICGLIDRLSTRYRVIAVDRPGFGYTDRPRHRVWTASAQAALLHAVLDRLGVERPLLVGHSWGTVVSLAMAVDARRDLRGLVLLSGYYFPGHRTNVAMAAPFAVPGFGDAARAMLPAVAGRALAAQSFRHVFRPQPVPARFTARFPVEIAAAATQMRAVSEDSATLNAAVASLRRGYAGLDLPVFILTGDADTVVDATEQSVRLHATIPGSTLKLLPGVGHMTHYAARSKVERLIDDAMGAARGAGHTH